MLMILFHHCKKRKKYKTEQVIRNKHFDRRILRPKIKKKNNNKCWSKKTKRNLTDKIKTKRNIRKEILVFTNFVVVLFNNNNHQHRWTNQPSIQPATTSSMPLVHNIFYLLKIIIIIICTLKKIIQTKKCNFLFRTDENERWSIIIETSAFGSSKRASSLVLIGLIIIIISVFSSFFFYFLKSWSASGKTW